MDDVTWLPSMFTLFPRCVSAPFTMFWFESRPAFEYKPSEFTDGDVTFTVLAGDEVAFARYVYCVEFPNLESANICGNNGAMLSPLMGSSGFCCLGEDRMFGGRGL